ncbi:MAG: type II toxin-antitoxin system prevent-host-death family antitoxin [Chloroflexi bacterium]|nr:type II toxin-antitoxin system prevent-host-death family antitoxin [Chloroflexota bacterium]
MREREPMTQTMKASQARQEWSQLLNKVFRREIRVMVEKSGIPVAAIISAQDLERLNQLEAGWEEDWRVIEEIRSRNRDKRPEEVERDVANALAAVRKQTRTQPKQRAVR